MAKVVIYNIVVILLYTLLFTQLWGLKWNHQRILLELFLSSQHDFWAKVTKPVLSVDILAVTPKPANIQTNKQTIALHQHQPRDASVVTKQSIKHNWIMWHALIHPTGFDRTSFIELALNFCCRHPIRLAFIIHATFSFKVINLKK